MLVKEKNKKFRHRSFDFNKAVEYAKLTKEPSNRHSSQMFDHKPYSMDIRRV